MSAYACYVNLDVWAEAGLDPAEDFPYTFEALPDVAEKLTIRDENGVITRRGFDFNWSNAIYMMLHFNPMVQQLGGDMIDEVNYVAHINTPEVKRVLEYWNNWANEWNLGGPEYVVSRTGIRSEERMATECSMGNWAVPLLERADSFIPNWGPLSAVALGRRGQPQRLRQLWLLLDGQRQFFRGETGRCLEADRLAVQPARSLPQRRGLVPAENRIPGERRIQEQ